MFALKRAGFGRALALVAAAATLSCTRAEPDRRSVAASIFPLYDVARRVAGDRLRVAVRQLANRIAYVDRVLKAFGTPDHVLGWLS